MINRSFLLLLLILFFASANSQPELSKIRTGFFEMENDSCGAMQLFRSIQKENYNDALMQAYAGATEAAAARCAKGAFTKLEYFSRGKKNLEAAIEQEPDNAEIRFLRFATQASAPNFLDYDNQREDKKLILAQMPQRLKESQNRSFWIKAATFMIDSGKLTKEESQKVEMMLLNSPGF
jgi:hypothetical protein